MKSIFADIKTKFSKTIFTPSFANTLLCAANFFIEVEIVVLRLSLQRVQKCDL